LESRIIEMAFKIKRYKIENYNQATQSSLPPSDRDAMEEFLTYIKLLIGVHGHKILEDVFSNQKQIISNANPIVNQTNETNNSIDQLQLFLSVSNINAKAIQTNEGIVVLKGSEAAKNATVNLSGGYNLLRQKLIESHKIILEGEKYIFQDDVLFNSASPAAASIVGYNINGRVNWKDSSGKTLKDIEEKKVE
jgi:hypothetical protein